ncbi:MAG: plastocyanin/azurin family copper-binding protein [Cyanobacteria bacterium P01_D01_bin.123]
MSTLLHSLIALLSRSSGRLCGTMWRHWAAWRRGAILGLAIAACWLGGDALAIAKSTLQQTPVVVSVELGTVEGSLRFVPDALQFKEGKLYALVLSNPSPVKHYFTAKDFADAIWTRKVEVAGAEVKGHVNNIELKPGAELEWAFVPIKPGTYSLICPLPGHGEAGMQGEIVIKPA